MIASNLCKERKLHEDHRERRTQMDERAFATDEVAGGERGDQTNDLPEECSCGEIPCKPVAREDGLDLRYATADGVARAKAVRRRRADMPESCAVAIFAAS